MASAGPLKRLYVMVEDFDPQIAGRTLDAYEPAAPLSLETVTTAGLAGSRAGRRLTCAVSAPIAASNSGCAWRVRL